MKKETRDKIFRLFKAGKSHRAIAAKLGVTYNQVNRTLLRGEGNEPLDAIQKRRYEDEINKLRTSLKTVAREQISSEAVREKIYGLAGHTAKPPKWTLKNHTADKTLNVPVTIWSDWHWGENINQRQINGVNQYSLKIAKERLQILVSKTIALCFEYGPAVKYPGIVINLGGDMISGDIHDELVETNEASAIPAVIDLFDSLVWALGEMKKAFGKVFIPCSYGNHGRNTKKPRHKNSAYHNFDWQLYCLLERHFKKDPDIVFMVPDGTDIIYSVFGHRFLLTHGDTIGGKGGDGFIGAIGPIMRGDGKIRSTSGAMNLSYDHILMGHWHQYMELPNVRGFVNGSLKGYDEYAKAMRFGFELPTQALFFVNEIHGITFRVPVVCVAPERGGGKKEWAQPVTK